MNLSFEFRRHLLAKAYRLMESREPDLYIGGRENCYLSRWWVIPRNFLHNWYLHQFHRSDDDRALHDHPWLFNISIILSGSYLEHTRGRIFRRKAGQIIFRTGWTPHRIELLPGTPEPITLFITGPVIRTWGFHCPKGWVPNHRFLSNTPGESRVGRGCE